MTRPDGFEELHHAENSFASYSAREEALSATIAGTSTSRGALARDRIEGNALVFTYRRLEGFFHGVAERTFAGRLTFCSFWPNLEPVNFQKTLYHHLRAPSLRPLTEDDYHQIIARCGVLRLLPWSQSRQMVAAMWGVIEDVVDRARPDYLLMPMVCDYMTDLLDRICRRRGVRVIGLVAGSIENTILLTSRGELNHVRDPDEDEVERVLAALMDDRATITYHYAFQRYSFAQHARAWATWWAKCAAFKTAGLVLRDPLNFRFLQGSLTRFNGQHSLWSYRCSRFWDHDWKDKITGAERPLLFVPLGHTPEATVSYWLKDLSYIDYESFIVDLCRRLAPHYVLVVKEHWTVVGRRRWPFYARLKSVPGVVLVPPEINARQVMAYVDRVLVGAGSAGFEAAVREKKVVTLDRPYYYLDGHYLNIESSAGINGLPQALESHPYRGGTDQGRRAVVRRVLEGTFAGHKLPDRRIDTEENYETASRGLRDYLRRPL